VAANCVCSSLRVSGSAPFITEADGAIGAKAKPSPTMMPSTAANQSLVIVKSLAYLLLFG